MASEMMSSAKIIPKIMGRAIAVGLILPILEEFTAHVAVEISPSLERSPTDSVLANNNCLHTHNGL